MAPPLSIARCFFQEECRGPQEGSLEAGAALNRDQCIGQFAYENGLAQPEEAASHREKRCRTGKHSAANGRLLCFRPTLRASVGEPNMNPIRLSNISPAIT